VDGRKCRPKSCDEAPSGNYPECGNGFLPSNLNTRFRVRPGFLFPSFQLIGRFAAFPAGLSVAARPARHHSCRSGWHCDGAARYTFGSNVLQARMTKPETEHDILA
jgi:hypothetical protein